MRRSIYLAAFVALAVVAALLTLRAQRTVPVVVATRDLGAGAQVQASDLEIHRVHDDGVPAGALTSTDGLAGQYTAWPLTAGEPVLGRMLRPQRSGGAVAGGLGVPAGFRAIAVPVQPAAAVGGMLAGGDRVDVFATPLPGREGVVRANGQSASTAGAGAGGSATGGSVTAGTVTAVRLGHEVLVLELRSDQGQALDSAGGDQVHGLNFGSGKLGSVVLAVPESDVPAYAAAVAEDSIYLALSVG